MAEERAQRRLAAILAADVVGYSRLIEQNEAGHTCSIEGAAKDYLGAAGGASSRTHRQGDGRRCAGRVRKRR